MVDARRTVHRKDAFRFGVLHIDGVAEPVECMIWDTSEAGAKIEVSDIDIVPDRVRITLPNEDAPRAATVVWRRGLRLGLTF